METETSRLGKVDTGSHSILPTGKLKIDHGIVLQEAEVIVHRGPCAIKCVVNGEVATREFTTGLYTLWFQVPIEFIKAIRSGQVQVAI